VLVVDDNADLLEMLGMVITTLGHHVRKASDGPAAIAAAVRYGPDVVLLDLGLPGMSGLEVAKELRKHPRTARARLVALTGWGQAEHRRQTAEAGFDDQLTKPIDPETLERLLGVFARA
jgi:CheY-like chemotaxis protein